jgi:hypothetical protein
MSEFIISKKDKDIIVIHNEIIKYGVMDLNLVQFKIILYCFSKIDKSLKANENIVVDIRTKELLEILNIPEHHSYLKKNLKQIMSKPIIIKHDKKEIICNWFNKIEYMENVGIVRFKIHDEIKEYLLVDRQFTKFIPKAIMGFKCKYSIFFYMYLKMYSEIYGSLNKKGISTKDIVEIELETIYSNLNLSELYKKNFYIFRIKILDLVLKDLKNTDVKVINFNLIRTYHRVTSLIFEITYRQKIIKEWT